MTESRRGWECGIVRSVNGLMRAVERDVSPVVPDGIRTRYPSELLFGNAKRTFYVNQGGTAGYPVPEFLGAVFFVFLGGFYVYFLQAMANEPQLCVNEKENPKIEKQTKHY